MSTSDLEALLKTDWFRFIQFAKPYSGVNPQTGEEKRFYDEREWRYIPVIESNTRSFISTKEFDDSNKPDEIQQYIKSMEEQRLIFEPDDIRYIIVKNEADVADFVKEIRNCERFRLTNVNSFDSLFTRILSMERIKEDF